MVSRCYDPAHRSFRLYGARGITVCEEWRNSIHAFIRDVGARPSKAHTLDRIDNSRGYEPGNVRWATAAEQNRNTRRNVLVTYQGERMTMADAADRAGVNRAALRKRIKLGWPEDCLFLPMGRSKLRTRRLDPQADPAAVIGSLLPVAPSGDLPAE